jgi:hypothetical protein
MVADLNGQQYGRRHLGADGRFPPGAQPPRKAASAAEWQENSRELRC